MLKVEDADTLHGTVVKSYDFDGEVTCLSLCRLEEKSTMELQAGLFQQGQPLLGRARIGGELGRADDSLTTLDPSDSKSSSTYCLPYAL